MRRIVTTVKELNVLPLHTLVLDDGEDVYRRAHDGFVLLKADGHRQVENETTVLWGSSNGPRAYVIEDLPGTKPAFADSGDINPDEATVYRIVTAVEELDALPAHTLVLDGGGDVYRRVPEPGGFVLLQSEGVRQVESADTVLWQTSDGPLAYVIEDLPGTEPALADYGDIAAIDAHTPDRLREAVLAAMTGGERVAPSVARHALASLIDRTPYPDVTRVTVVGTEGLVFECYGLYTHGAELHLQDDGRTLKLVPLREETS